MPIRFPSVSILSHQRSTHASLIGKIEKEAAHYANQTDLELRQQCRNLQFEAMAGSAVSKLLVPSFALTFATIERVTGMRPYPTQVRAGIELCKPCIVEMATGEGKTLTALLPTFLRSLNKRGLYFATSNDYLARRDAAHAKEIFDRLGITIGCIQSESTDDERRQAYQCDVTYGTTSQFGFDFLRDRAKRRFILSDGPSSGATPVGRGHLHALIADEADGLLIDEAVTPMVISSSPASLPEYKCRLYQWAHQTAGQAMQAIHYKKDPIKDKVELTEAGRAWVRQHAQHLEHKNTSALDLFEYMERAILIHNDYERDARYIIQDGKVIIVDENTGRLGIGREWSEGIQQAIQAKENLPITAPSGHLAKISVQNFVRSFKHVSGMTGTAAQSAREFKKIYKLKVRPIPTYRRCLRTAKPTIATLDRQTAFAEVAAEIQAMAEQGRPVLVGTRTIHISEELSHYLSQQGTEHTLLNAKNDEHEAEIIADAGEEGRITIATNMAGRGTDIKLSAKAFEAGGLHVIALGIHNSKRIDRQLIGRCARQGDPGSYRIVLFLDDDLLDHAWGPTVAKNARCSLREAFTSAKCISLFKRAQKAFSHRMESNRAAMLYQEKKSVKKLSNAGLDPVLEIPG